CQAALSARAAWNDDASRRAHVMQDQRSHRRVNLDTELWLGQDGVFTRTMARLGDVSVGGARIVTAETYQVGSILSLRFRLGSNFVTVTSIVRNAKPASIGVEFLDLSSENREVLEAYITAAHQGMPV